MFRNCIYTTRGGGGGCWGIFSQRKVLVDTGCEWNRPWPGGDPGWRLTCRIPDDRPMTGSAYIHSHRLTHSICIATVI